MLHSVNTEQRPAERRARLAREASATLALSWPLIVANLAQSAMTTTDLVMLGRLSPKALAAGALGFNLFLPMLLFGVGLVGAVSPIAASLLGARPDDEAGVRTAAHQAFLTALGLALPMWAVLWNARSLLIAFGEEPDLAALAATYLHGLQWRWRRPFCSSRRVRFSPRLNRPGATARRRAGGRRQCASPITS